MKLTILLVVFVGLAGIASAAPAKGSTKPSLQKKKCLQDCSSFDYKPVCAGDGTGKNNKSFGSTCVLQNFNCEQGTSLEVVSEGECPGGGGIRLA